MKITDILHELLNVIYPKRCVICDKVLKQKEEKICKECKGKVTVITEPVCKHCGKPIWSYEEEYCHDCSKSSFFTKRGFAIWVYDKHMKNSIAQFKYANRREYVDYYVEEMLYYLGNRLSGLQVDALIPVPIHKDKLRYRGFNQAELLAKGVGKKMEVPIYKDILIRGKNTKPQKSLSNKERRQNLKHAFSVSKEGKGKCGELQRVLLVDDIYTTGATIEECAKVLVESGVKEVYFVCLCIGKDF